MSRPEITLTQTKVYEIRKFVSSRTARVYHDLNMAPRCGVGDSIFYEALCSLRVDDQLLNELEPRPSTTECFRCATKRLYRERAAISAAIAEVERPKMDMGPWTTLADALRQIAVLEARDGNTIKKAEIERNIQPASTFYHLRVSYYTPEQMEYFKEKGLDR